MDLFYKLLTIQALVGVAYAQYDFIDISPEPTVFATDALPRDENNTLLPRYIGSVGNGHISTTLYTDTVYMNGLYNGERGESHRARIPSRNNIKLSIPADANAIITDHTYGLDVANGFFFEKFSAKNFTVEQRTFAHRHYNRLIVTQFILTATAASDSDGITLLLTSDSGLPSADIHFSPEIPFNSNSSRSAISQCGHTLIVEDAKYQPENLTACVVSHVLPQNISVNTARNETFTFFTSYDFNLIDAGADFNAAEYNQDNGEDIYVLHQSGWSAVWEDGLIEIEGNVELSKIIYGCLYYILSALPVTTSTNLPTRQFYGLSPGGLAYGDFLQDYQGHSFWDTETWMYPTFLYLYPTVAEQMLNYRLSVIAAARDRANETNYKGARYPWEGAVTGREVTPDCCEDTRDMQIHITSDISYAVRQYIATTRDTNWLINTKPGYIASGCTMIREMAEFYTSRADFNITTRLHDIRGIMPPDEDNRPVDNNPYTNIGAGYAIFFAKYAECLCAENMTAIPQEWVDLASSLALIYDEEHDYHPEFEGYVFGTPIKQADVVLIGFPQQYEMDVSTRENDLLIYENVTRWDGPAMTWAMHTIGFLDLNDTDKAAELFNRSYQNYVRQPYKVWTEAQPPTLGAINFITGMGGFLQSVVSGYGGYRLFPEKIVFKQPRVPPNSTALRIRGLDYLENIFDLYVTNTIFTLTLVKTSGNFPLVVQNGDVTHPFVALGTSLNFTSGTGREVTMSSNKATGCALPLDKIGTPIMPQTSSATTPSTNHTTDNPTATTPSTNHTTDNPTATTPSTNHTTDNPTATTPSTNHTTDLRPSLFLTLLIVGLKFRAF